MLWTSALAIYLLFWALCLFLVLPFHAHSGEQAEKVPGQADSAPAHFRAGRVVLQVTLVSLLVFALYYANYVYGFVTAEDLNLFGRPSSNS